MNILRFLREQAKNYECSVCGTNHSRSEISVLGEREGAWVVHVACSSCKTTITLLVSVGGEAPAAKTRTSAPRRDRRPPVSFDDVLDAHELLGSHAGDAAALFAPRQKVRSRTTVS